MSHGRVSPCPSNVKTITVSVAMRITSRAGNGAPFGRLIGRASAAASDTTPRMPAHDSTSAQAPGRGCSRRPPRRTGSHTVAKIQSARTSTRTTLTRIPMPTAGAAAAGDSALSSIGNSRPMMMKTKPLSRKVSISHTARPMSRASAPIICERRCPR